MMLIPDNDTLFSRLNELGPADVMVGRVRVRPGEEGLLLFLEKRGVRMCPSSLSQLLSRSKVMQAVLLNRFMHPLTRAVYTRHDLFEVIAEYGREKVGRVVSKLDRGDGGLGIHMWSDIEALHNQASFGSLPFPFVIQPYLEDCRDLRLVILGDYCEAYWRENPAGFRNNLHAGGISRSAEPEAAWLDFAARVMQAGDFPYGHIDLLFSGEGFFLGEINLRGGLRGAAISSEEYRTRIEEIHQSFIEAR